MTRAEEHQAPDGGWKAFRRLLSFWSLYKANVAVSAACAIGVALLGMAIARQIGRAIQHLKDRQFDSIPSDATWLLVAALAMALLGASRRIAAGQLSLGLEQHLRERLFSHLTGLGFRFFDRQQTGQLLSRVTSDVSNVRFFLGYGLTYAFMHAAKLVGIPIYMWVIDPVLAAIVFVTMPLLLFVSVRFSRRSHPILRESQQKLALVTAHGEETLVGARVVRSFGQEDREVARFRALTDAVVEQERRALMVQSTFRPLYSLIPNLTLAAVVLVGAQRIEAGDLEIGVFTTFFFLVFQLSSPLRIVGSLLGRAQRATASSSRLWELLDADDRIPERDDPLPVPTGSATGAEIRFECVRFGYREGRRVLDDISLVIPAGQTVALLGPTGCGKTTLASMIPRFYDPEAGRVLIDGVDLRDIGVRELRRTIGLVDQEPYLFSATVAGNLRYGDADASEEQLWAALDAAQAREFVERLPQGIDTVVGERGLTLSGGQRQRLAIARALVADPHVLILDDATASVDSQVEARIRESLGSAARARTTIVIAHRPSTIALADHIVVMGDGRIEDQGTHDELIERNRTYQLVFEQRARPEDTRREFLLDPTAETRDDTTGGLA